MTETRTLTRYLQYWLKNGPSFDATAIPWFQLILYWGFTTALLRDWTIVRGFEPVKYWPMVTHRWNQLCGVYMLIYSGIISVKGNSEGSISSTYTYRPAYVKSEEPISTGTLFRGQINKRVHLSPRKVYIGRISYAWWSYKLGVILGDVWVHIYEETEIAGGSKYLISNIK